MFDSVERTFDNEKEKRVVQMYESGRYINAIQDEVSVSPAKMYSILEKYGIKKRNVTEDKSEKDYLDKFPDYVIEMIRELYKDESNKVEDILDTLDDVNRHQFYRIIKILGLEHRRPQGGDEEKKLSQVGGVEIKTEDKKNEKKEKIETVSQDVKSISIKNGSMKFKKGDIEMDITGDIEIKFN